MRIWKSWWVVAALTLASIPSAAAALEPRQEAPSSPAPAQARTLVKYIASGSIAIPAAAGSGYFDRGLAVDSAGNIYVGQNNLSTSGPDIAVLDSSGRLLRQWSAAPFGDGPLIAIGRPDGLVYVQNRAETFVRVFTPDGVELVARRIEHGAHNTKDIEVDDAGNVYVVARGRGDGGPYSDDGVFRFSSAGQLTGYLVPRPGTHGDDVIGALAVAPDGSVYITAYGGLGAVVLFHLDASGKKLPVFDPRFFLPGNYYDVEFANGRLHFSGPLKGPADTDHTPVAFAVFTPQGELVDFTVGTLAEPNRLQQFAVRGEDVYVRGLDPDGPHTALASHGNLIGNLKTIIVQRSHTDTLVNVFCGSSAGPEDLLSGMGTSNPRAHPSLSAFVDINRRDKCAVTFQNRKYPCHPKTETASPVEVRLGGRRVRDARVSPGRTYGGHWYAEVYIPPASLTSGDLVLRWSCVNSQLKTERLVYEHKGAIALIDPSGTVRDTKRGTPVDAATVQLEYAPERGAPYGAPTLAALRPQIHPQVTGRDGRFGWDVAPGFWRLRVNAFGYRPFRSAAFQVPPERKGLKLRLRQNPAEQARLIDLHRGQAGAVRIGAKAMRVAGLAIRIRGGRVRAILISSRRFQTARGIRLGSRSLDLVMAYVPRRGRQAREIDASPRPIRYRVGKATFTVRRGRVVGIKLGR